jgi:uncharacterized membrane protein YebE (DUF533 family)
MIAKMLVSAAIAVSAVSAFAQANTPGVDQRQANQEARIQQGVASGQLNRRETARLERGQRHVQNMENRAKSDGVVTGAERARLQRAEDVQSARIHRQKHDRQVQK